MKSLEMALRGVAFCLFLWQYQNKCVNNSKTIPHLLHPPKKMCLHMIFIPSAKTPSKQRHTNNLSF